MISKKSYPTILLIAGFVFFFIYMLSYPRPESADMLCGHTIYVQDNIGVFFIKNYAETGSMKYPIPYYDLLPSNLTTAFTPRDAAQVDGYIVPKYSLGIFVGIGTLVSINKDILLFITPLFAVLSVISLYILTRKIFGAKIGVITSLLAFTIPPMLVHGSRYCTIGAIPSAFFLLIGFFYFIKLLEKRDSKYYFLSTLFLACSIVYRYPTIIYIFPFLFYILFYNREIMKSKKMLIIIVTIICILVPILILNNGLYGSFLTTGYQTAVILTKKTLPYTGVAGITPDNLLMHVGSLLDFNPDFFLRYTEMYLIRLIPLYLLGFIMGLLFVKLNNPTKEVKYYCLYTVYIGLITVLFYGSHITHGLEMYTVMASFIRYSILLYLLMMPLFVIFLQKIANFDRRVVVSLISIFVIICLFNSFTLHRGIIDRHNEYQTNTNFYDSVILNTEPDSIIITRSADKILFPDRQTVTAHYMGVKSNDCDLKNRSFFNRPLDFEVIAHKAAYIANQGITVYVTDIDYDNLHDFKQVLLKEGYTIEALGMKPHKEVYKIVRLDENRRYVFPFVLK